MHPHMILSSVVFLIEASSVLFSVAVLTCFTYNIVIMFCSTYLTFWCTGSQRRYSYLQHGHSWRGSICSWFPCTPIPVTGLLHMHRHFAWHFHLQQWRAGEKPTVISMQFVENAYWGGSRVFDKNTGEEDSVQDSERNSSILCAESTFFAYCTSVI